ncbi:MAG: GNAT family N-acetyltransferase [Parachlamydiaceae bacterium]|nr:MAG: GNAT family N-acetyltransferase [Parachlamydiaceae bacterium]
MSSAIFNGQTHVYVCRSYEDEVIGGFYIKPNYSGRSKHIANAAYMLKSTHRGKGIGSLLVKASLHLAKEFGFLGMQFNMVLSENIPAIKLYQKLGFEIIGTLPKAVRKPQGNYQDGFIMYRKLDDL